MVVTIQAEGTASPRRLSFPTTPMASDLPWAISFVLPYLVVFVLFVIYPVLYGLWLGSSANSYRKLFQDPIFFTTLVNTALFLAVAVNLKMVMALGLSAFFLREERWIRWLSVLFVLAWAMPSIPTILSFRWMFNPEWGMVNSLIFQWFKIEGPGWLTERHYGLGLAMVVHIWKSLPFWTLILLAARMAIPKELYEAAAVDGARGRQAFFHITWPSLAGIYLTSTLLSTIWKSRRFQQYLSAHGRRSAGPDAGAGHTRHSLSAHGPDRRRHGVYHHRHARHSPARLVHDAAAVEPRRECVSRAVARTPLLEQLTVYAIGLAVFVWTMLPIYHLVLIALAPPDKAVASGILPQYVTLQNFENVLGAKHNLVQYFWQQLFNSVFVAGITAGLTLAIAVLANFAIARLRLPGGRTIANIALLTYLIPAAFLAIPLYRTMGIYGLLDSPWSMIFSMVTLAAPYGIWVLNQAAAKLPMELDEAARIDGATPLLLLRHVYLPLMAPTLVAIGIYALLLAWNEYLYAFLMLSTEPNLTLPVALGNFLSFDDAPWSLLMATGLLYALPPTIVYYVFRRYMVAGLTAGAVKS